MPAEGNRGGSAIDSGDEAAPRPVVLVVDVGGRSLGFLITDVDEVQAVAAVTPLADAPAVVEGLLDLDGAAVPVIEARRRLGMPPRRVHLSDRLVVVRTATHRIAVRVESIVGLVEVVGVDVEAAASVVPEVLSRLGVVRTDDGLLVVVDPDAFLSAEEAQGLDRAIADLESEVPA